MFDAKLVADIITTTRGLLGLIIIWLGFTQGEDALPIVALLMLLDWTGDFVDGTIAKRSRHPRHTWIGDSDIYVDAFMSVCLGIYLISAKFVGFTFGFCYLFGWILILWRFGLDKNLLMLAQTPIYLWFVIVTVRLIPSIGNWLVVWVLVALMINWRRFSKDIVPKFISEVGAMLRGHHS
jgi:hypothetical protein